jgi:hypothetical protein
MKCLKVALTLRVTAENASFSHIMPTKEGDKVLKTTAEYISIIVAGSYGAVKVNAVFDTLLLPN